MRQGQGKAPGQPGDDGGPVRKKTGPTSMPSQTQPSSQVDSPKGRREGPVMVYVGRRGEWRRVQAIVLYEIVSGPRILRIGCAMADRKPPGLMAAGSDDDTRDDDDDDDDDEDDEEDDENSVAELQGLNLLREKPEDFVGSATIMAMHRMFQVGCLASS